MRLWSLHPAYLDRLGLVSTWREALLAQKVLQGRTKGYRNHPQLVRFRLHREPVRAIGYYLSAVANEAAVRGYRFDRDKIQSTGECALIPCTEGQLRFECEHLKAKLRLRDPDRYQRMLDLAAPQAHPLFRVGPGAIESWEVVTT
jgi:hypothetical protein